MKRRTMIIMVIVLLLAAGAYIGWRMYDEKTPDVVNAKPDAATDVTTLLAAFEKDTASASREYIDKIVEIRGNVKSIDTSGAVVLGADGNPSEVVVGFDRRHMDDFRKLKVGGVAVLQGICSGYTKASEDPEDMLAALGTTVQFRSAGVKNKN